MLISHTTQIVDRDQIQNGRKHFRFDFIHPKNEKKMKKILTWS